MFDRLVSLSVGTEGAEDYMRTFQDISELARNLGEAHSYVSVSSNNTEEYDVVEEEHEDLHYDEFTLVKVHTALLETVAPYGHSNQLVDDLIRVMQNAGILFRECKPVTENAVGDRR